MVQPDVARPGRSRGGVIAVAAGASAGTTAANPHNLKNPGTLTVGMTLQFKPQMYLDAKGKPGGLRRRAPEGAREAVGGQARHQEPRLQRPHPGPRREEVRHGLGRPLGDARAQEVDQLQPAVRAVRTDPRRGDERHDARRRSPRGTRPTRRSRRSRARRPSSSCRRPSRTRRRRRSPTRTRRSSRSRRAARTASWSRTTSSRSSTSRTATRSRRSPFPKPLHVEYGSYGVQKGNAKLAADLSKFICKMQKSGQLAKVYQATIGAPLPQMPACK